MNKFQCLKCEGTNIIPDYDKGKLVGMMCMNCGSRNYKERKKEVVDMSKCKVEGCTRKALAKGVCSPHYREKYGHGYKPETSRVNMKEFKRERMEQLKEKIGEDPVRKAEAPKDKPKPLPLPMLPQPPKLILDFCGYEEVRQALEVNAQNEMRTPAMQVLWILKSLYLKGAKEAA